MKFFKEFREFAIKGNVLDMAVGIIIGAAFSLIVKSLVDDIVMPPIGMLLGNLDFSNLFILLKTGKDGALTYTTPEIAKNAGAVTLNYGRFISHLISFLIVAFTVFLIIKAFNRMKKLNGKAEEPKPTEKTCQYCFSNISIKATRCPHCTSEVGAVHG